MPFSDQQMDAAVARYRQMTVDEYYRELQESPDFKAALEAAFERAIRDPSKNFVHVDAEGWTPLMFNRPTPPARPNEHDPYGPGAHLLRKNTRPRT